VDKTIDIESDHRLIATRMTTPMTKNARQKRITIKHVAKPDTKSLENEETRKNFIKSVTNELKKKVPSNSHLETHLIRCLGSAAQSTLPKVKRRTSSKETWKNDHTLNDLLKQREITNRHSEEYKSITKDIKRRVRHLRNEKLANEAKQINQFANQHKIQEMYRSFKSDNSSFKETKPVKKCDPEKLKAFFQKHFTSDAIEEDPIELQSTPDFLAVLQNIQIDGIKVGAPNEEEIIYAIKKQKTGKSTNDIPMEYIKYSMESRDFVEEICNLYSTIWETKLVPKRWGHSKLVTLWKGPSKGKATEPDTYRGLQIGSSLCKILITLILNRINIWYEKQLLDQQQGFRTARGTTDGIFIAKSVQQITNKMKKPVYAMFVDLSAAFDHVERKWLFQSIKSRFPKGFNPEVIQLLETLYENTTTYLAETPNDEFKLTSGVRQGGPESPILYNLYMDYVMRIFMNQCKEENIHFLELKYTIPESASSTGRMSKGNLKIDWCGYADDLLLVFNDEDSLKQGIKILDATFRRYRLKINEKKTKSMIFNQQFEGREYPSSISSLNGKQLENVKSYRYLGSEIRFDEHTTGETEINLRSDAAECKFYSLTKHLLDMKINIKIRALMLNSLIRSRITYSCQTWSVTKRQLDQMSATYMLFLRKMIKGGYRRKEDSMSYILTNNDLMRIANTVDLRTYIKDQQRSFVGKVINKDNTCIIKRLMFNSNEARKTGPQSTLLSSVVKNENCSPERLFQKLKIKPM